jgi:phage terminase large subunit-like protein
MTPGERFEALKKKYHYDAKAAEEKISFIEKHCTHVEGDLFGHPLILPAVFKDEILRPIFGLRKANGKRLIRKVYIQMPRKNAKTTMMAAVELALLFNDGENSAQIYNCAGDDEQAGLLFSAAKKMVDNSATLRKASRTFTASITYKHSFIKKITSKSETKHGFNSHGWIYDELHVAPNRNLYDTLNTSTGQRSNPLGIMITTPGTDMETICYQQYDYSKKLVSGAIEDDTYWCVIYESDPEADIYSPETWRIANPLYEYSENLRDDIAIAAKEAKNDPVNENSFRRLKLGQWTSSETKWMKTELWTSLKGEVKIEDFLGEPCWLGVDRSSTEDISSLCVLFEDGEFIIPFWYLWISGVSAKEYEEKYSIKYSVWEKAGHIEIVEGTNVGPYGVKNKIIETSDKHPIVIMGYDEWNTVDMAVELQDELDIETIVEKQGYGLSVGIKKMKEKIKAGQVLHSGNPIVTWSLENILVKEDDELRIKFVKPKDYKKIDPWVSFAMATRNWMEVRPKKSVYSTRGVITVD